MKPTGFVGQLELDYEKFGRVSAAIQNWIDVAEEVAQQFASGVDELAPEHAYLLEQWRYWIREFKVKASEWDEVFLIEHAHYSTWLEVDRRSLPGSIRLFKKPINVTPVIQQLFDPIREHAAIVWTSGTLTVPNNERFITDQLGINVTVPIDVLQAAPSYYSGAKTYVVTDMPDIYRLFK